MSIMYEACPCSASNSNTNNTMSARQRSPSIEIVSFGPPAQPRKTALGESTRTAVNQTVSRKGASAKGTSAAAVKVREGIGRGSTRR